MSALRFILSRRPTQIMLRGERYPLPANCLAIADSAARTRGDNTCDAPQLIDFHAASLHQLYLDMIDLTEPPRTHACTSEPVKIILVENAVLDIFASLIKLSPESFLQFTYIYCLSLDRPYFSALLHNYTSGNKDFCQFVEDNFARQMSVHELAQTFGLPVRKFNQLFQDTYGKPAKRWLLDRRMKYAQSLLSNTAMRVIDVALECGFSNHAHFADSFRRYFDCSPSQFRQRAGTSRHCTA